MINKLLKWFRFNLLYLRKPPWDTGITPPEVYEFLSSHPPGRVLDMGCGTGTNLITFISKGWQACGVDFSPLAVAKARKKIEKAGLSAELYNADVSQLSFLEGQFDLILDIGCYHSLSFSSRKKYQSTIERVLKPGGYFLIYAHLSDGGEKSRSTGAGFSQQDEQDFKALFVQVKRVDSHDRFGRLASWMTYQRPIYEKVL
mgnify:CR=1 FL=1